VLVGATIDSSQKAQGIITLTYDGTTHRRRPLHTLRLGHHAAGQLSRYPLR
jgi:hypothetical protein